MKRLIGWLLCITATLSLIWTTLPAWAEPQAVYGDADGDGTVTAQDALLVLQTVVGKQTVADANALAADVSGDYFLTGAYSHNAADALLILQYVVGKTEVFPAYSLDPLAPAEIPTFRADGILTPGKETDFVLDLPAEKDIKILQLSDLQSTRLDADETCRNNKYKPPYLTDSQTRLWQYVDEAVAAAEPDLIVLTGDNVHGIFDDNGRDFFELCEHMDSFEIPWLLIFGNHDKEALVGIDYQISCLKNSKYCLFASPDGQGTSDYSVVLRQGENYRYVLYMTDTHGTDETLANQSPDAHRIISQKGLTPLQLQRIKQTNAAISHDLGRSLPSLVFMHIAPEEVAKLVKQKYPKVYKQYPFTPWLDGDFGVATETVGGVGSRWFVDVARQIGCKGVFFGHQHRIAMSVTLQDIRMTWGLKTGRYSYHDNGLDGGTLITIPADSDAFTVEYLYSQIFD